MLPFFGFTQSNCTIGGININATGSFTYINGYEPPFGPFPPATVCTQITAPYTGVGQGTGNLAGGSLTYTFSKPVTSATVSYSAVTNDDVATVTINGCGTPTLSSSCRFNVAGNIVSCDNGFYGDAVLTVTSGGLPFTTITITNINNASGIVMGNPCKFLLTPYVCSIATTPALSTLSLTNICPSLTVNLNSITASNTPSCSTLTWHTSTPATNLNLVSNANAVTTGTYYASFLVGGTTTCFGPTKAVTVNTYGCNSNLSITKNISNLTPSVGSNVSFTIVVTNNGTDNANNVVAVDNLLSGYTFVSASTSSGSWSAPNWNVGNLNNGASATLTIVATVRPTGNYSNSVSVTSNQADINLSNNSASVTPNVIYAVNDNFSANSVNNIFSCDGGSTPSVFGNDLLNNNPVSSSNVTVSFIAPIPIAGATINSNGVISIPSNVPAGIYNFTYQICQSSLSSNCTTATATIKVVSPIFANDDNFTTPISALSGGLTPNILSNDTVNGTIASAGNVVVTIISSSPNILNLNVTSTGQILIPPGLTNGTYTITYSITRIGCSVSYDYGVVTIIVSDIINTPDAVPGIRANNIVSCVDTQSDNKIIISGYFTDYNGVTLNKIARLKADLTVDNTTVFNTSGPLFSGVSNTVALDLKVLRSPEHLDKILVVGSFTSFSGSSIQGRGIARLMPNGDIDPTFNTQSLPAGTIRGVSGSNSQIRVVYVYPPTALFGNAGKILIGGMFQFYNGYPSYKLARLNSDGSLDTAFSNNINTIVGDLTTPTNGFNSAPQAIDVNQVTGDIIVGGHFTEFNGYSRTNILRLHNDGTLDLDFNKIYMDLGGNKPNLTGHSIQEIIIQPNGSILIGGFFSRYNNQVVNSIARLLPDGALDFDFNFNPNLVTPGFFPTYNAFSGTGYDTEPAGMIRSMVYEPAVGGTPAKLFVSGDFTKYNGLDVPKVILLNCAATGTTGSRDISFKMHPTLITSGGPNDSVWSMKKQGAKLLLGGKFTMYNTLSAMRVTRVLPVFGSETFQSRGHNSYYESEMEIDLFSNESDNFIISPNPSNGIFSIRQIEKNNSIHLISIYNILGQKVFEKETFMNDSFTIDLEKVQKGTYFVTIADGVSTKKKIIVIK